MVVMKALEMQVDAQVAEWKDSSELGGVSRSTKFVEGQEWYFR
jgi:hypothetical protein